MNIPIELLIQEQENIAIETQIPLLLPIENVIIEPPLTEKIDHQENEERGVYIIDFEIRENLY